MPCEFSLGIGLKKKCYRCAKPLTGRRTRWCSNDCGTLFYANHLWRVARKAAKKRDKYRCVKCGSKEKLEVDHIIPLRGSKRNDTCLNHLENLQVLCRVDHLKKTNAQRKSR